jgi:tRNA pseudouridine55 synthase
VEVEREPRPVTVHGIEVKRLSDREYYLDVRCSKGTYIRTLCADIGARLGVGGAMKTLCRLSASGFTLADGITLEELEQMSEEEREERILPTELIFEKYPALHLPPFFARLAEDGQQIYLSKLPGTATDTAPCEGELVRLCDKDGFFALGEVRQYDGGLAAKPIRQFRLREKL